MIQLKKTTASDPEFASLVAKLDAELAVRDGDDHAFYDQFNKIDALKYVIVAYEKAVPVGCGAIKEFDPHTMEVKRMYVCEHARGRGIASAILEELEEWCLQLGFKKCILETGIRQPEAIALYEKKNYRRIDNYGQYAGVENSVCFEKLLE